MNLGNWIQTRQSCYLNSIYYDMEEKYKSLWNSGKFGSFLLYRNAELQKYEGLNLAI